MGPEGTLAATLATLAGEVDVEAAGEGGGGGGAAAAGGGEGAVPLMKQPPSVHL